MRCACIHDLAGLGHCSLTAAIPVLSVMGVQACPIPTAVLSSQTDGYSGYSFLDMTPELPDYIAHWARLGERFDGIFTGFLGSPAQLSLVLDFMTRFRSPQTLVLVDPVMGDDGAVYDTYTGEMCDGMRKLAGKADVITPNLTEAAHLLGESYDQAPHDEEGLLVWAKRLSSDVAPRSVITGVPSEDRRSLQIALCDHGDAAVLTRPLAAADSPSHGSYPGTGDVFASVLMGALLRGKTLRDAAALAADFVSDCVRLTAASGSPRREGLSIEPLIANLIL
ncbi:MAG: pyridoxamine kinase [Clostridiaceae bacterium]|nr:pyridoxamine kinase [Clostridiaceae bacterium]